MSALPKFNFKSLDLDDAKLTEMIDADGPKEGKFFRPGKHEVQITSSTYMGQASDPTWAKWVVKFAGTGGKETSDMLMVPTAKLTYTDRNGKEGVFAVRRLKDFLTALGATFSTTTLGDTLATYFGKEDALKGQNIAVTMGYDGTHITFLGKSENGNKRYGLAYRSGDRVPNTPEFADFDEATAYCEEKGLEVKRFVDVLKYDVSSVGNKKVDSNW